MGFSTNYENVNDDYGILPEGDYEVIIRNIEERTTKKGSTGLNLSLVVRNDIEQKFKDRYIFNQIMRLAKSAKLPNGKAYESVMDLCKDLMHRPIKVTLEHREWNGQQQENVKYVNASEYPDCKHVFKEKKQVTTDTVAAPPNESFAADMPKQPENLSLGNLDDFEEIVSDGEVPF